jgi:flavin reductase (DIM6/NTAB) family NADH-FMN oxidoreductase RutF
MPFAAAAVYALAHAWAERHHRPSFHMTRRDRLAFEVLYICPRPVVLVSVRYGDADNLFPMDLIGPAGGPHFVMALRSTSPSVELMTGSGRMSIADVPLEDSREAIRLGDRHKMARMDWDALPFETDRSPQHGFRVPAGALRVRDLVVRGARPVGSHTVFVTEVVAEQRRREGLQMCTVSGPYYRYLRMRGVQPPRPL